MNIILASQSEFRQNLLKQIHLPFKAIPSTVDESKWKGMHKEPKELAIELSYQKAKNIQQSNAAALVIGSDQVCYCHGHFLSKPKKHDLAIEQLEFLSGKTHQLFSAYAIIYGDTIIKYCDVTDLKMKKLSTEQIDYYLKKDQPYWCAGSYKLEEMGVALFEEIKTQDSTAVIGLPLIQLTKDLESLGVNLFN